jgi:hypothetical protein
MNRQYSAVAGRFAQADPYRASGYVVDPQSWNRYAYARNNPVNRIDPLGLDDIDLGSIDVTAEPDEIDASQSGFTKLPGFIGLQELIDMSPPRPPQVLLPPVQPIEPPPPPKITSTAEMIKYWPGIRDWIKSKGNCGERLSSVISRMDNLMSTPNKIFLYDMRDAGVPGIQLGDRDNPTPADYFRNHPSDMAFTVSHFLNNRHHTFEYADIFFRAEFFSFSPEEEALGVFHELLHGAFQANNNELGIDMNMNHDQINSWINEGCP